jgi:anti-anti-sigma factor
MTIATCELLPNPKIATIEPAELAELAGSQLLRGEDARLVERLQPMVMASNVALDLACVDRIDAAGITALLALYHSARKAGHRFSVTNASERVAGVLSVVGLDGFLLSHDEARDSQYGLQVRRSAA